MSSPPTSFSRIRRLGIGLNVMAAVSCVFALCVMVNYLANRHYQRWQLAPQERGDLAPQTIQVLKSLTNDIEVVVFFDADEDLFEPVTELLRRYQQVTPHIRLSHVDFQRNPAEANRIKTKYSLLFPEVKNDVLFRNVVLFESQGRVRVCYERQLSDYDLSGLVSGKSREVKRSAFLGEMLFTSAIVSVSDPAIRHAYFLTGHREYSPEVKDNQAGYAQLASVLRQNNIEVSTLSLRGTTQVPTNCQLLVVAGAQDRFLAEELERIDSYLQQGGRMLALLHPLAATGLETVLARWGVEVGKDLLFDRANTLNGFDLITSNFFNHAITRPLFQAELHIANPPRSIASSSSGRQNVDTPKVEPLVATGEQGVAVTDIRNAVAYPTPQDRRGSIPFIVAVERGGLQGVSADRGATRLVVAGEAQFLANQIIYSKANLDFAVQTANWLLDRPQFMGGIQPRPVKEYRVVMSRQQVLALRWFLLAVLPGGVLLTGSLVWLRRRL
ncbi:MAG TPA: Gldg family protein [Candidatus Paceibacterota bacterium]|nr:Gldg family protein [Verrucomicrobiota bacterium]HRY46863.1 Gldg family protein [Candidatus Paceibacterota bacterium]HSA00624.1 Gldg family protein [Candidatus Paceibacterota bacterium]